MAGAKESTSKVLEWLQSLSSPGMKLDRLSPFFESRGFRSRRSLKYLKAGDLDTFFSSPDKVLLAERRVLEEELERIKRPQEKEDSERPALKPRRLDWTPSGPSAPEVSGESSKTTPSSLDRRAAEHTENLQILGVQLESAKQQLTEKRKAMDVLAGHGRSKVCTVCHVAGHNKSRCRGNPCTDVNICKISAKHPELQGEIREIQKDVKDLEQKYAKAKSDNDVFLASRQRAKSSFFSVMRPRLRKQNITKYVDRVALDRELLTLQRALGNTVPANEDSDWRLPGIIEAYKRSAISVSPLSQLQPVQPSPPVFAPQPAGGQEYYGQHYSEQYYYY